MNKLENTREPKKQTKKKPGAPAGKQSQAAIGASATTEAAETLKPGASHLEGHPAAPTRAALPSAHPAGPD
jgi:hypothetical protein